MNAQPQALDTLLIGDRHSARFEPGKSRFRVCRQQLQLSYRISSFAIHRDGKTSVDTAGIDRGVKAGAVKRAREGKYQVRRLCLNGIRTGVTVGRSWFEVGAAGSHDACPGLLYRLRHVR